VRLMLDVHKSSVTACVRISEESGTLRQEIREFATTTRGLLLLRDWLASFRVRLVGMEATGVYWKPIYCMLEDDFELWLLNARHLKNVPGRKTDVKDAAWICQLVEHGLVRPSEICSEVVDQRFPKARGVPSQVGNRKCRRCSVGGKEHRCSAYTTMAKPAKNSPSTSTRSPVPEQGGCWPTRWRQKPMPTSKRLKISATKMAMPWSFAMGTPRSVRSSVGPEPWNSRLPGSTTAGSTSMESAGVSRA
jgi:Transposase